MVVDCCGLVSFLEQFVVTFFNCKMHVKWVCVCVCLLFKIYFKVPPLWLNALNMSSPRPVQPSLSAWCIVCVHACVCVYFVCVCVCVCV